MELKVTHTFDIGRKVGYSHSANVRLRGRDGMMFLNTPGIGVDPGEELFRIKGIENTFITMFDMEGNKLWDKELPDGVLPGIWFCPAVPFDMDGDGVDEIYFINNTGAPFSFDCRVLERLDAETGETTGRWPWPRNTFNDRMSLCYRFYLVAGYAHGEPVLVTSQGTYGDMYLQGWSGADLKPRWKTVIKASSPGPRASHVTPVLDFNEDGVDELFWGERLLSLDDGSEVKMLAPDYSGHSDLIMPFRHPETREWYVFTAREGGNDKPKAPRVVTFRPDGSVAWSAVTNGGHMHKGWMANVLDGYGKICAAVKVSDLPPSHKGYGSDVDTIYYFDAYTGKEVDFSLPYPADEVLPIDLDGDGYHEFIAPDGSVLDRHGNTVGEIKGNILRTGKMVELPGEQVMLARGTSFVIVSDTKAVESEVFKKRYETPYLRFMQKLMATGYNSIGVHVACGG